MTGRSISRAKRRWLRKHPAPTPPPEGFIEFSDALHPGESFLLSVEEVSEIFQAEMEDYDSAPQDERDYMKEHKNRPY